MVSNLSSRSIWGRVLEESIYLATTLQHSSCLKHLLSKTQTCDEFLPAVAAVARKAQVVLCVTCDVSSKFDSFLQETENTLLFASLGSCTGVFCNIASIDPQQHPHTPRRRRQAMHASRFQPPLQRHTPSNKSHNSHIRTRIILFTIHQGTQKSRLL